MTQGTRIEDPIDIDAPIDEVWALTLAIEAWLSAAPIHPRGAHRVEVEADQVITF